VQQSLSGTSEAGVAEFVPSQHHQHLSHLCHQGLHRLIRMRLGIRVMLVQNRLDPLLLDQRLRAVLGERLLQGWMGGHFGDANHQQTGTILFGAIARRLVTSLADPVSAADSRFPG